MNECANGIITLFIISTLAIGFLIIYGIIEEVTEKKLDESSQKHSIDSIPLEPCDVNPVSQEWMERQRKVELDRWNEQEKSRIHFDERG